MRAPRPFLPALGFALLCLPLIAQYPRIRSLEPGDVVFKQLMEDLDSAYRDESDDKRRAIAGKGEPRPSALTIYAFTMAYEADVFSLAARLNLPYDSLATLNRMAGTEPVKPGTELLIPSRPGIFLPEHPVSDLELLMYSWRNDQDGGVLLTVRRVAGPQRFLYFPAERFNSAERVYYLNGAYRYPLPKGKISSGFGMRTSPITGAYSMHSGIDLQAAAGTEVCAVRSGVVCAAGWDETLGNYVAVDHGEQKESVYGHLQKILVSLNQAVKSGTILGTVGSTGKSTGPHLHFEIRVRGEAKNPESFIPRMKQ
jgi:murein DD-endopeptidase MepM/ murein hydrolase activator NlpD